MELIEKLKGQTVNAVKGTGKFLVFADIVSDIIEASNHFKYDGFHGSERVTHLSQTVRALAYPTTSALLRGMGHASIAIGVSQFFNDGAPHVSEYYSALSTPILTGVEYAASFALGKVTRRELQTLDDLENKVSLDYTTSD